MKDKEESEPNILFISYSNCEVNEKEGRHKHDQWIKWKSAGVHLDIWVRMMVREEGQGIIISSG